MHKVLLKINIRTQQHELKWPEDFNRLVINEDRQMENNYMKNYTTSYVIKEMKIKTTMRCHYTLIRMAGIQNTENTKYC